MMGIQTKSSTISKVGKKARRSNEFTSNHSFFPAENVDPEFVLVFLSPSASPPPHFPPEKRTLRKID